MLFGVIHTELGEIHQTKRTTHWIVLWIDSVVMADWSAIFNTCESASNKKTQRKTNKTK